MTKRGEDADFVLAIDFGGTKVDLATADLQGHLVERAQLPTEARRGARQVIDRALKQAHELVRRTSEQRSGRAIAVGAVSPGVILRDRILLAPNIPGWSEIALHQLLSTTMKGVAVAVGNDVRAGALAEARWGSLRDVDPGVFLSLGTGISAAILVHGQLLGGAHDAAGEIGYSVGTPDKIPTASGHVSLENLIGGKALGERASRRLGVPLTAADAFAHSNPAVQELVDEGLDHLSTHLANMCVLLDPARVSIGGGLATAGERIVRTLTDRIGMVVPFPPEIVLASFLRDAPLRGAVLLALDAAHETGRYCASVSHQAGDTV